MSEHAGTLKRFEDMIILALVGLSHNPAGCTRVREQ